MLTTCVKVWHLIWQQTFTVPLFSCQQSLPKSSVNSQPVCVNVCWLSWLVLLQCKHAGSWLCIFLGDLRLQESEGSRVYQTWLHRSVQQAVFIESTVRLNRGSANGENLSFKLGLELTECFLCYLNFTTGSVGGRDDILSKNWTLCRTQTETRLQFITSWTKQQMDQNQDHE